MYSIIPPLEASRQTATIQLRQRKKAHAAALDLPLDVPIVGRGGGSLEDLWAFSEKVVASAIYRTYMVRPVLQE